MTREGSLKKRIEYMQGVLTECILIFKQKNHDYGRKIDKIAITGLEGIATRLVDKVCRIYSLADGAKAQVSESLEDTLKDVVNYALIGMCLLNDKW